MTTATFSDNPQFPSATAEVYIPDQLIAGNLKLVTENITVASGLVQRGTPLGVVTIGPATATPGANTGNGTISPVAILKGAKVGAYAVVATSATVFSVFDPTGARLKDAATGVAYADQIQFTITAGTTAFAAGDSFNVAVAAGSGSYIPSVATAIDGSQNPVGILVDLTDATVAPVNAGIYLMGEFNANAVALVMDASWTTATLKAAMPKGIFLKSVISGTPV